jgi:putative aminopeptidase FrvX
VKETVELLRELSEAVGVSGREESVRQIIYEAVKPHVDEIKVDALGNLITLKCGRGQNRLKVMAAAHMDEVGLMITGHEGNGSLKFQSVGGILDQTLAGKRVQVGPDRIPGVIGIKPIHLIKENEFNQAVKLDKLVIDIGASGKEEAEKIAKIGDLATFLTSFADLGPTFLGKAFDDRAGCAALVKLV